MILLSDNDFKMGPTFVSSNRIIIKLIISNNINFSDYRICQVHLYGCDIKCFIKHNSKI